MLSVFRDIDSVFDSLIPFTSHPYYNHHLPDVFSDHFHVGHPERNRKHVISLNVDCFKPEDITCVVQDGKLMVSGKYETSNESGSDKREFSRIYPIPEGYDEKTMHYRLTSGGVLKVTFDKKKTVGDLKPIVEEDNQMLSVKMDVTGFSAADLDVSLDGDYLVISGNKKSSSNQNNSPQEHSHSKQEMRFSRRILLAPDIQKDKISVNLSGDSLLEIKAAKDPKLVPKIVQLSINQS